MVLILSSRTKFPSPCGDYGSYPPKVIPMLRDLLAKDFRPLAGIMVLI